MTPVSYDHAAIGGALRASADKLYAEAHASAGTPEERAFYSAQHALTEATILQSTVLADLTGNGMPFSSIVSVFSAHCASVLLSLLVMTRDDGKARVEEFFIQALRNNVRNPTFSEILSVKGVPGGRA